MSKPRRWRLLPTRCRARSPLGAPAPSSWAHRLLPGLLAGIASTQNAGHHEKADHEPPPCGTLSFESECAHGRAQRGRLRCWIQEETDFGWRQAVVECCSRRTCARAASRLGEGDALQGRCSRVHDEESQLPAHGSGERRGQRASRRDEQLTRSGKRGKASGKEGAKHTDGRSRKAYSVSYAEKRQVQQVQA